MNRRAFLAMSAAGAALAAFSKGIFAMTGPPVAQESYPVQMSDAEWKKRLPPESYRILREHGTERAFASPFNAEKRLGDFLCAGCGQKLFTSHEKFDSGSGWPSFWEPASRQALGTSTDYKIGYARTEVHCARCGGHLGHVFDDGPAPTGKRYCINGAAMTFAPREQ